MNKSYRGHFFDKSESLSRAALFYFEAQAETLVVMERVLKLRNSTS
jgi:hypothetical protein